MEYLVSAFAFCINQKNAYSTMQKRKYSKMAVLLTRLSYGQLI
uniref:Uncharacterized protein n=1 Tax=Anguilla anguilla TaxID=7936 RepID=A0A0E9V795_ANGAN